MHLLNLRLIRRLIKFYATLTRDFHIDKLKQGILQEQFAKERDIYIR